MCASTGWAGSPVADLTSVRSPGLTQDILAVVCGLLTLVDNIRKLRKSPKLYDTMTTSCIRMLIFKAMKMMKRI